MRASEFLNEDDTIKSVTPGKSDQDGITITIPTSLLKGHTEPAEESAIEPVVKPKVGFDSEHDEIVVDPKSKPADELADLLKLAGQEERVNTTIAQPASNVLPDEPIMVPPLQQQIELVKQQNGKASPVINQILANDEDEETGSTAGEQPEQSVYHDSPLQDNEWVGAGTGSVEDVENATTTQGATKPWYKL